jgi:hypothetical protein
MYSAYELNENMAPPVPFLVKKKKATVTYDERFLDRQLKTAI